MDRLSGGIPGELESLTGDRGRANPSATGGSFLAPFRLESRDLLLAGSSGNSGAVPLVKALRLLV